LRGSIRLGSVLGIPISLNFSWFFTFAFVTLILGLRVYPDVFEDSSPWLPWTMAVISGLLFFASILTHEMAHSLIARAYGIPVKGITLFVFGGVSQITREAARPLVEFIMAFAGPATSIVLSGLFLVLWWFTGAGDDQPLSVMWQWLWLMNLALGIFNLAPGFPMDGGRILRSVLWGVTGNYLKSTLWASRAGQGVAYSLMLIGFATILRLFPWMEPLSGLWLVVLGMFLEGAARQSWRQTEVLEALRLYRASDVLKPSSPTVEARQTLDDVAETPAFRAEPFCVFVTEHERVVGVLGVNTLSKVPRGRWPTMTAAEAMIPATQVSVISPEEDAASVLQTMDGEEMLCLPVVEDGRLLGYVSRNDILRLLARHQQLPV
jgi:Zn-dependent protease